MKAQFKVIKTKQIWNIIVSVSVCVIWVRFWLETIEYRVKRDSIRLRHLWFRSCCYYRWFVGLNVSVVGMAVAIYTAICYFLLLLHVLFSSYIRDRSKFNLGVCCALIVYRILGRLQVSNGCGSILCRFILLLAEFLLKLEASSLVHELFDCVND